MAAFLRIRLLAMVNGAGARFADEGTAFVVVGGGDAAGAADPSIACKSKA